MRMCARAAGDRSATHARVLMNACARARPGHEWPAAGGPAGGGFQGGRSGRGGGPRQPTLGSFMTTELPMRIAGISVVYVSLNG